MVVAVDPALGVDAESLAKAWNEDAEARESGPAEPGSASPGTFLPDPAELIYIPLAVNLASNVVYDVVRRLVARTRQPRVQEELEIVEHDTGSERLVIVRARRDVR